MNDIDFLLAADCENAVKSKMALEDQFPEALEAANLGASVFQLLARRWGEVCDYDKHLTVLNSWAVQAGVKGPEVLGFLADATLIGSATGTDTSAEAKDSLPRAITNIARAYIMVRIPRDYLFGLTDLLRLRMTPAVGYIRLQSESAGLLKIMATDSEAAQAWFDSMVKNEGSAFYRTWQSRIKGALRSLGLEVAYEQASEQALHCRPWGITRGILIGAKKAKPGTINLIFQEEDEPVLLLFAFKRFLDFHLAMMEKASDLYPELAPSLHAIAEIDDFRRLTTDLHRKAMAIRRSLGSDGIGKLLRQDRGAEA